MQGKELHDFLFKLYDYADYLADQIRSDGDSFQNNNYFLSIVMLEKFFDRVGRAEISAAARQSGDDGINPAESLSEAHRRIDLLRDRISQLVKEYEFDEVLDHASRQLAIDWHKK